MSDNTKRYDLAQIRRAIAALVQRGQIVEVRMMNKKKKITATGWYDDYEIMAKHIAKLARDGFGEGHKFIQENVYWTVNPVHEGLLAREIKNDVHFAEDTTSDINILSRRWIPVDIDPLRPSGVSATKEEKARAKEVTALCNFGFRRRPARCQRRRRKGQVFLESFGGQGSCQTNERPGLLCAFPNVYTGIPLILFHPASCDPASS